MPTRGRPSGKASSPFRRRGGRGSHGVGRRQAQAFSQNVTRRDMVDHNPDWSRHRRQFSHGQDPSVFFVEVAPHRQITLCCVNREQVESAEFLSRHKVDVIVTCTGRSTRAFHYARRNDGVQPVVYNIPVNAPFEVKQAAWNRAKDALTSVILRGGCIVCHCNQGYHRGPIGFAAVMRLATGKACSQSMHYLAQFRQIWPGHLESDATFEKRTLAPQDLHTRDGHLWVDNITRITQLREEVAPPPPAPAPMLELPAPVAAPQASSQGSSSEGSSSRSSSLSVAVPQFPFPKQPQGPPPRRLFESKRDKKTETEHAQASSPHTAPAMSPLDVARPKGSRKRMVPSATPRSSSPRRGAPQASRQNAVLTPRSQVKPTPWVHTGASEPVDGKVLMRVKQEREEREIVEREIAKTERATRKLAERARRDFEKANRERPPRGAPDVGTVLQQVKTEEQVVQGTRDREALGKAAPDREARVKAARRETEPRHSARSPISAASPITVAASAIAPVSPIAATIRETSSEGSESEVAEASTSLSPSPEGKRRVWTSPKRSPRPPSRRRSPQACRQNSETTSTNMFAAMRSNVHLTPSNNPHRPPTPSAQLRWLMDARGSTNAVEVVNGFTLLHHAIIAVKQDSSNLDVVRELVEHVEWHQLFGEASSQGPQAYSLINTLTGEDRKPPCYSALHMACTTKYSSAVEVVALLLRAHADPNLKGHRGQTPIMMACGTVADPTVRILLNCGETSAFSQTVVNLELADDDRRTVFDRLKKGGPTLVYYMVWEEQARRRRYHPEAYAPPEHLLTGNVLSSARKRKGISESRAERYIERGGKDLPPSRRSKNKFVKLGIERQQQHREACSPQSYPTYQEGGAASSTSRGDGGLQPEPITDLRHCDAHTPAPTPRHRRDRDRDRRRRRQRDASTAVPRRRR